MTMNPQELKKKILQYKIIGLSIGIILPILSSPLVVWILVSVVHPKDVDGVPYVVSDFYEDMFKHDHLLRHVINLSCIANLLAFFSFLWLKKDFISKGVIAGTILWAAISIYSKMA